MCCFLLKLRKSSYCTLFYFSYTEKSLWDYRVNFLRKYIISLLSGTFCVTLKCQLYSVFIQMSTRESRFFLTLLNTVFFCVYVSMCVLSSMFINNPGIIAPAFTSP